MASVGHSGYTFPAKLAFVRIDKCQVIIHGDGFKGTNLEAFGASDTGHTAVLFGHCTFLFIDAADKYFPVFFILFAQLNDIPGTGIHTGPTGSTFRHPPLGKPVAGSM